LARRRFVYRRLILWGDCDPAAIVYTPRFLDYTLEAIDAWMTKILGINWYAMNTKLGIGGPIVHASLDFSSPAKGGERLDIAVDLAKATRSALTFAVTGSVAPKRKIYVAKVVVVIIDGKRFKSIDLPPQFRRRIDAYLGVKTR
jgi:acyl-CoA thioesterase FadM